MGWRNQLPVSQRVFLEHPSDPRSHTILVRRIHIHDTVSCQLLGRTPQQRLWTRAHVYDHPTVNELEWSDKVELLQLSDSHLLPVLLSQGGGTRIYFCPCHTQSQEHSGVQIEPVSAADIQHGFGTNTREGFTDSKFLPKATLCHEEIRFIVRAELLRPRILVKENLRRDGRLKRINEVRSTLVAAAKRVNRALPQNSPRFVAAHGARRGIPFQEIRTVGSQHREGLADRRAVLVLRIRQRSSTPGCHGRLGEVISGNCPFARTSTRSCLPYNRGDSSIGTQTDLRSPL